MHNDVSLSNIIVDDDKMVGLVDWEMAGFFGWRTAASVHVKIRMPKRENFSALSLSEEVLSDILFWNDLYDVE
jgi:aminoglycoside phosphotransferase